VDHRLCCLARCRSLADLKCHIRWKRRNRFRRGRKRLWIRLHYRVADRIRIRRSRRLSRCGNARCYWFRSRCVRLLLRNKWISRYHHIFLVWRQYDLAPRILLFIELLGRDGSLA
jgi:hypothetical protein